MSGKTPLQRLASAQGALAGASAAYRDAVQDILRAAGLPVSTCKEVAGQAVVRIVDAVAITSQVLNSLAPDQMKDDS